MKDFLFSVVFAAGAVFFCVAAATNGFVIFCIQCKIIEIVAAIAAVASEGHLKMLLEEGVKQSNCCADANKCTDYNKQNL